MPLYKYKCKECEYKFEMMQNMSDDAISKCPKCDGAVRRVIQRIAVVFKGSGFYKTS